MAPWFCVHDLVGNLAWNGSLELIDVLLAQAADDEIGFVAAGPLEELVYPVEQGRLVIVGIESRARQHSRWAQAVAGVWLAENCDADVNRRMAMFGARYANGQVPQ